MGTTKGTRGEKTPLLACLLPSKTWVKAKHRSCISGAQWKLWVPSQLSHYLYWQQLAFQKFKHLRFSDAHFNISLSKMRENSLFQGHLQKSMLVLKSLWKSNSPGMNVFLLDYLLCSLEQGTFMIMKLKIPIHSWNFLLGVLSFLSNCWLVLQSVGFYCQLFV